VHGLFRFPSVTGRLLRPDVGSGACRLGTTRRLRLVLVAFVLVDVGPAERAQLAAAGTCDEGQPYDRGHGPPVLLGRGQHAAAAEPPAMTQLGVQPVQELRVLLQEADLVVAERRANGSL
jgi:hypothetical protein